MPPYTEQRQPLVVHFSSTKGLKSFFQGTSYIPSYLAHPRSNAVTLRHFSSTVKGKNSANTPAPFHIDGWTTPPPNPNPQPHTPPSHPKLQPQRHSKAGPHGPRRSASASAPGCFSSVLVPGSWVSGCKLVYVISMSCHFDGCDK